MSSVVSQESLQESGVHDADHRTGRDNVIDLYGARQANTAPISSYTSLSFWPPSGRLGLTTSAPTVTIAPAAEPTTRYESEGVMTGVTREEIDAKFEAAEARSETRFVELNNKIDRIADSISSLNSVITREVTNIRSDLSSLRGEVKEDYKFTRWTIIGAIVASLLAAAGALWVTQGNLLAAFQAGIALHSEQPTPPGNSK